MMKKYLMLRMLAVVLLSAVSSCRTDVYDPDKKEKDAKKLYEENFKAYIGGEVNNQQEWGFNKTFKSRALTRATGGSANLTDGYDSEYTKSFMDLVKNYFPEDSKEKPAKPAADITSWEFEMYSTQADLMLVYSNTQANDEVGLYYYDPATETPEQATRIKLIENIQNGLSPYFMQMVVDEQWDAPSTTGGFHVWANGVQKIKNNMFAVKMDPTYYFGLYVTNLDTKKTYYTNVNLNAKKDEPLAAIVGITDDAFSKQNDDLNYVIGLSDDDTPGCELIFTISKLFDFPLVKIQDPKPEPVPPVQEWTRIIAEDLNAHDIDMDGEVDDTDFDFNDIVLDIAIDTDGKAHCILQAAGATLKIRINEDDNLEVHKLFGVAQGVMVNTNAKKRGMSGEDNKDPIEFTLDGPYTSAKDVKIHVYRQNSWMELTAPKGGAASKIAVPADFVWPDERVSLKTVYPDFPRYAIDDIDAEWWKNIR